MARFLDDKFRNRKLRYVAQCLLAGLVVFVLLVILDAVEHSAVIASLGASAFIAFTMPHQRRARTRFLIGGYVIGVLCAHLGYLPLWAGWVSNESVMVVAIFAGLAVAVAILLMVVLDFEHPPAAGVALGLVLNRCEPWVTLIVLAGILVLATSRIILKRILIDLL